MTEELSDDALVAKLRGLATEAALRLIAGAFRRDGEQLSSDRRPRFSIPTRPDHDDDCVVTDSLKQAADALSRPLNDTGTVKGLEFEGVAKRKLDDLMARGWRVSGYSIMDETGKHGFVTTGGFVGWWLPEHYPSLHLTETALVPSPPTGEVAEATVERIVQAVRPFTRDTLFLDELRDLVRSALGAAPSPTPQPDSQGDGSIRICPRRDGPCPHGMGCTYCTEPRPSRPPAGSVK
jgi:hypothetical protein